MDRFVCLSVIGSLINLINFTSGTSQEFVRSSGVKNRCHHSAPQIATEFMIPKESGQTSYTLGN